MALPLPAVGVLVLVLGALAIFVGGPLTLWIFRHVERRSGLPGQAPQGIIAAAGVLRGGEMIGRLERTAPFVGLATGYPEALAAVIALKGLGRFAELRGATEGTAERFIIGSFTSLLWACLLGALARLAIQHVAS